MGRTQSFVVQKLRCFLHLPTIPSLFSHQLSLLLATKNSTGTSFTARTNNGESASSTPSAGATAKAAVPPPPPAAAVPRSSISTQGQSARDGWTVVPGYSSGASSYAGSDAGSDNEFLLDGLPEMRATNHSDILALGDLKQEMIADGDLAKTMVRIETPFDTPIEEIYAGVFDGPVLGSGVSGIVRLVTHR